MKYFCILMFLLVLCRPAPADEPIRERVEWIDVWVTDADKAELPRVLFVGDSITKACFGAVEKHLAGRAYCARLTTSKSVSDPTFNDDLLPLLKQYKFSVIHFNNGLHGWGYTEEQYRAGLSQTVAALKEYSDGAQLIWATTTPVRKMQSLDQRTDRVKAQNSLAAEIMKKNDISTNDLFELVKDHPDWQSTDGIHFNAQGNEALAKQVVENVLNRLQLAD